MRLTVLSFLFTYFIFSVAQAQMCPYFFDGSQKEKSEQISNVLSTLDRIQHQQLQISKIKKRIAVISKAEKMDMSEYNLLREQLTILNSELNKDNKSLFSFLESADKSSIEQQPFEIDGKTFVLRDIYPDPFSPGNFVIEFGGVTEPAAVRTFSHEKIPSKLLGELVLTLTHPT